MNKLITLILALTLLGCNFSSTSQWGHHFVIINKLGYAIDSLEIIVGDKTTKILKDVDGEFSENIDVPETGYPHLTSITLYHNDQITVMKCDSFNCYNCDGSHEYIVTKEGGKYVFRN